MKIVDFFSKLFGRKKYKSYMHEQMHNRFESTLRKSADKGIYDPGSGIIIKKETELKPEVMKKRFHSDIHIVDSKGHKERQELTKEEIKQKHIRLAEAANIEIEAIKIAHKKGVLGKKHKKKNVPIFKKKKRGGKRR